MTTLREMVNGLSDEDLRLLVLIARAATRDVTVYREFGPETGKATQQLGAFREQVLNPLAKRAGVESRGAAFSIHIDKVWVEDRGVADKGCVAFHVDRDVDRAALEAAIAKAAGEDAQLEHYDPSNRQGQWFEVDWESEYKAGDVIAA